DPRPDRSWFEPSRLAGLEERATEAGRLQDTIQNGRASLLERFENEVFEVASPEFTGRWDEAYTSWLRILKPAYHRDMKRLKRVHSANRPLTHEDATAAVREAQRVARAQADLDAQRETLTGSFSRHYAGGRTDWAGVQHSVRTVRTLESLVNGDFPEPM